MSDEFRKLIHDSMMEGLGIILTVLFVIIFSAICFFVYHTAPEVYRRAIKGIRWTHRQYDRVFHSPIPTKTANVLVAIVFGLFGWVIYYAITTRKDRW